MKRIVKISITSRKRARVTETLTTAVRPAADHAASDPVNLGVVDGDPSNAGQPTSGGSPKDFDLIPEEDPEI
ncbi:MAG TPA: hypothetical protein VMT00_16930 [Thermoanaerobaculia bacterium]|nr:hypothetical protein [Thermoanaerobaculia bacterium]